MTLQMLGTTECSATMYTNPCFCATGLRWGWHGSESLGEEEKVEDEVEEVPPSGDSNRVHFLSKGCFYNNFDTLSFYINTY